MAYNTFKFVGNLFPCRKTEKFTPYEERTFNSGWVNRTLRFNIAAGNNRHTLDTRGGSWKDGHGNVVTQRAIHGSGRPTYERYEVKWSDRMKPEVIENVPDFRKFIVDMEENGKRDKLQKLVKAFDDGTVTDEMLASAGVSNEEEAHEALEKSKAKRKEFITEWDFVAYVNNLVNSDVVKNKKFIVDGNIEISEYNGKFYTRYAPNHIVLAEADAEPASTGVVTVCFDENAIDDGSVEEKGKYFISAYTFNYDGQRKTNIPCPVMLTLPVGEGEKKQKLSSMLKENFTVDSSDGVAVKELGIKINIIDGAEVLELTEDMLTENERDLLLIGEVTMEQLIRERGGNVYGDRIREWVVSGFARNWSKGSQPTAYTSESFIVPPIESAATNVDIGEEETVDEEDDI